MVKRGKVAVVGPSKLEEDIMPAFEKRFSTAMFFPVSSIQLTVGKQRIAKVGNIDLRTFDYVLVLPDSSKKEFYYNLVRILEDKTKVSVSSETLYYFWNKPIMTRIMSEEGVPTRRMASISQNVAADFITNEFRLPVILTAPSGKRIYVSNDKTLKNVLSLFPPGYMITVQKPIKASEIYVTFISRDLEVGYKREDERRIALKLDSKICNIGRTIRDVVDADFCTAIFVCKGNRTYLSTLKLVPDFEIFKSVTGKDLAGVMAEEISQEISPIDLLEIFESSLEGLGRNIDKFARWIGNEISNIGAPKKKS